ncbi:MAG: hypothetical protein ABR926_14005 [Streptosporangiaceae bacterium]|jgi:hypothetical protein
MAGPPDLAVSAGLLTVPDGPDPVQGGPGLCVPRTRRRFPPGRVEHVTADRGAGRWQPMLYWNRGPLA